MMGGRPSSDDELATLDALVGRLTAGEIAARLGRTRASVWMRAKKRGLRWYDRPAVGYTALEVSRLLGVSPAYISTWLRAGVLGGHHGTMRLGKGYAVWRISGDDLATFLRDYQGLYDARRIRDRAWRAFVATLPPDGGYVPLSEAARRLGNYTLSGIKGMVYRGDLPAIKVGARWWVSRRALAAWEPPPPPSRGSVTEELRSRRAAVKAATGGALDGMRGGR